MDRMALVSDVHGNLTAFEAVLADIEARGIDRVLNLGDYVGKGPRGREVIELAQQRCEVNLLGNWDDFLPDPDRTIDDEALRFWLAQLAPGQGDWLRSLPFCHDFWLSGRRVRLFHASEKSVHRRVRYVRSQAEFESLFDNTEATGDGPLPDLIGYADTHDPMYEVQLKGRAVFNTGSVGNCMGDPTPMYCILEGELGGREPAPWSVAYVRVPYDVEAELAAARDMGMPQYDMYELELVHGIYRGSMAQWRAGEPFTGYHER